MRRILVNAFLVQAAGGRIQAFCKNDRTFLAEVGVLLFVFPVLDEYVQHSQHAITGRLIEGSMVAALSCYAIAGLLAAYTGEEGNS